MATIQTLTGTSGGPVGPDTNRNINLLGTNVTVVGSPSAHVLTISALTGVATWFSITANTPLVVNSGYACVGGLNLQLTLPIAAALGATIEVTLDGAVGFTILQNAGQQIRYGSQLTTVGITGQLISINQGDSVRLVCSGINKWNATSTMGNLTVV